MRSRSRPSAPSSPRCPVRPVLDAAELDVIAAIGDNTGCMALKGASRATRARSGLTPGRSTTSCARSAAASGSRRSVISSGVDRLRVLSCLDGAHDLRAARRSPCATPDRSERGPGARGVAREPAAPTANLAYTAKILITTNVFKRPGQGIALRLPTHASWGGGPHVLLVLDSRSYRGKTWLRVALPDRPNGSSGGSARISFASRRRRGGSSSTARNIWSRSIATGASSAASAP